MQKNLNSLSTWSKMKDNSKINSRFAASNHFGKKKKVEKILF